MNHMYKKLVANGDRQRLIDRYQRFERPLRFGLVGMAGVVVNSAVLWMLARGAGLPVLFASVLATEVAIVSNFFLNDRWTFGAVARHHTIVQRFVRFNGVSLGGMGITVLVLIGLTTYTSLALLIANLLAVMCAMSWNYLVNSRWTWRTTPVAPHTNAAEHSGRGQ